MLWVSASYFVHSFHPSLLNPKKCRLTFCASPFLSASLSESRTPHEDRNRRRPHRPRSSCPACRPSTRCCCCCYYFGTSVRCPAYIGPSKRSYLDMIELVVDLPVVDVVVVPATRAIAQLNLLLILTPRWRLVDHCLSFS